MNYKIINQKTGNTFSASESENILQAALSQGIIIPYGCKNGLCGSCKGKIIKGSVDHGDASQTVLNEPEKKMGFALFCQSTPKSDLTIDVSEVSAVAGQEVKKLPCRIQKLEKKSHDVMIIELKLPSNQDFSFLAGQYVNILLRDGKKRSYSMANSPSKIGMLELHVRKMDNGTFSDKVFNELKEKEILRFEGPFGTFYLREDSEKPIIFVASGTGFAPIKSVIENAFEKGIQRKMTLYWGGRRPSDIYQRDLIQSWKSSHSNFECIEVISDATSEDNWAGRSGFVHLSVLEDYPDLSGYQVYACGAPVMVEAAHNDFVKKNKLPSDEFFSDAFTPPVDD